MSKIKNNELTTSGTQRPIIVAIWLYWSERVNNFWHTGSLIVWDVMHRKKLATINEDIGLWSLPYFIVTAQLANYAARLVNSAVDQMRCAFGQLRSYSARLVNCCAVGQLPRVWTTLSSAQRDWPNAQIGQTRLTAAYRPTSLTVLIEASHKCGRMRRESRPQSPACLMYLAWTHKFRDNILYRSFNN